MSFCVVHEGRRFYVEDTMSGDRVASFSTKKRAEVNARSRTASLSLVASDSPAGKPLGYWRGVITAEDEWTGDDRKFEAGSLTWEPDSPAGMPLRWAETDEGGHRGARHVGWIEEAARGNDNKIYARGPYFDKKFGQYLERAGKVGLSVDVDKEDYSVVVPESALDTPPKPGGLYPALSEKQIFNSGRVRGVTAVDIPAFITGFIVLDEDRGDDGEDTNTFALGEEVEVEVGETSIPEDITHAGILLSAKDTNRWLMLQRALADGDKNGGLWEFPGGGIDENEDPETAARREFAEEVGVPLPEDAVLSGYVDKKNYRLYVFTIAEESGVDIDGREVINPDDPDGDFTEALAWWSPEHTMSGADNIRKEVTETDWTAVSAVLEGETPSEGAEFTRDGKRGMGDGPDGQNGRLLPRGGKGPAKKNKVKLNPDGSIRSGSSKPKPKKRKNSSDGSTKSKSPDSPSKSKSKAKPKSKSDWIKTASAAINSALSKAEGEKASGLRAALAYLNSGDLSAARRAAAQSGIDLPQVPSDGKSSLNSTSFAEDTMGMDMELEVEGIEGDSEEPLPGEIDMGQFLNALGFLEKAVDIHKGHLDGSIPTDEKSQNEMMGLMMDAQELFEDFAESVEIGIVSSTEVEDEATSVEASQNEGVTMAAEPAPVDDASVAEAVEVAADEVSQLTDDDKTVIKEMIDSHNAVLEAIGRYGEKDLSPTVRDFLEATRADVENANAILNTVLDADAETVKSVEVDVEEGDSMVASAAPVAPPDEWFAGFDLGGPTPLTVTPEGQVYGHLATWNSCHRSSQYTSKGKCVTPPSDPKAPFFHMGQVVTASGAAVDVGVITVGGGHADPRSGFAAALEHYDDASSVGAVVRAIEDEYGIGLFGAVVADATPEQVAALRRAPLSGDWRRERGQLRLIAAHAVNTPGFPIPREDLGLVASVGDTSLITLGRPIRENAEETIEVPDSVRRALSAVIQEEADAMVASYRADMASIYRDEFIRMSGE